MLIESDIVVRATDILVSLVESIESGDETNVFKRNALRPYDFPIVARATTQLIEICSWLQIMPHIKLKLRGIVDFLSTKSVMDRAVTPIHPSRLKAILLFNEYNTSAIHAALWQLCEDNKIYTETPFDITHLSYIDLLGTYLFLYKSGKNTSDSHFPRSEPLVNRITELHKDQLRLLSARVIEPEFASRVSLTSLSYIMRLIIVNRLISDEHMVDKLQEYCGNVMKAIDDMKSKAYLSSYQAWNFPQLAYSFIVLFWCQRKLGWELEEDSQIMAWLRACAEHLKSIENPYHAGLFVKLILAARKNEFLTTYYQKGLDAQIVLTRRELNLEDLSVKDYLLEAMRESIKIETTNIMRLTAGWSKASVFRVKANIFMPAETIGGDGYQKEYVVKLGQESYITDAADIYSYVPDEARILFVRHHNEPFKGTIGREGLHFIIMEHSTGYEELTARLSKLIPPDLTATYNKGELRKTLQCGLSLISRLHHVGVVGINRLHARRTLKMKIAELFSYESQIARKHRDLAVLLNDGLILKYGRQVFPLQGFSTIVGRLINFPRVLSTAKPGTKKEDRFVLSHGDCHGNNIMIKADLQDSHFIDIADVKIDDYLEDFVQIVAHICFSFNLEKYNDTDLTHLLPKLSGRESTESLELLYPERWDCLKEIWEYIIATVYKFANGIGDKYFMARFSILLGRRLLFIASKSVSPIKTYILYIQAMVILQNISEALKDLERRHFAEFITPPSDYAKLGGSKYQMD